MSEERRIRLVGQINIYRICRREEYGRYVLTEKIGLELDFLV